MSDIKGALARSKAEVRANLRLRHVVYRKERGYGTGSAACSSLEYDEFDALATTRHCNVSLVRAETPMKRGILAAARLVYPSRAIAAAMGWELGLPLERKVHIDLSSVAPPGSVAEVGRFCVARQWRGTTALLELCRVMCDDSLANNIEYWVSAVNLECDSAAEAVLILGLLNRRRLVRHDIPATEKVRRDGSDGSGLVFFKEEGQRRRALAGDHKVRLPDAVEADIALGARFLGDWPLWDADFGVYTLPLLAAVRDVRESVERLLRLKGRRRATTARLAV